MSRLPRPSRPTLPVLFRYKGGIVTAVFPTLPFTSNPADFTVADRHGHCAGNRAWYNTTRKAKPSEYRQLWEDLRTLYASGPPEEQYELVVKHLFTRKHDEERASTYCEGKKCSE